MTKERRNGLDGESVTPDQICAAKFKIFNKLGYEIHHETVRRFHESTARVKVCTAARRTTKSFSAAHDVLADCLLPDNRGWIVGPNYSLAEKEFRYIHQRLVVERDKLGLPEPTRVLNNARGGQLLIEWPWGASVEGKSADNAQSLLGESNNWVIYAEAGQLPRDIREKYVGPTLNTRKGREIIPTTPEEGAEWVYELFCHGQEGRYPWIESFTWDGHANPVYDWEDYERAKEFYGEDHPVFQEQYLGKWVFYGGRVYPMFNPKLHIIQSFQIPSSWKRIRAIDFGHRDPFVCLWGAISPNGAVYIYREYYSTDGHPTKIHAQTIKDLTGDEYVVNTVADPSAAQLITDLSFEKIYAIPANNDRYAGRQQVANYLLPSIQNQPPANETKIEGARYPKLFIFEDCKELIREIRFYRWKEKPKTHKEGEKEKTEGDDHALDSLRYMMMTRPAPFAEERRIIPGTFNYAMEKLRLDRVFHGKKTGR